MLKIMLKIIFEPFVSKQHLFQCTSHISLLTDNRYWLLLVAGTHLHALLQPAAEAPHQVILGRPHELVKGHDPEDDLEADHHYQVAVLPDLVELCRFLVNLMVL